MTTPILILKLSNEILKWINGEESIPQIPNRKNLTIIAIDLKTIQIMITILKIKGLIE